MIQHLKAACRWLPYVALLFVVAYVWRERDGLTFWSLNPAWVVCSFLLLAGVFALRAWIWAKLLGRTGHPVSYRIAAGSLFKPILAKYIPGKVWMLLSTAAILERHRVNIRGGFLLTLLFQVSLIASGLLVGVAGLLFSVGAGIGTPVRITAAVVAVAGTLLLCHPDRLPRWLLSLRSRKKEGPGEPIRIPAIVDLLAVSMAHWVLMGLAFYAFWRGIGLEVDASSILLQPLAINLGVLALIAPGGVGAREGVMIGYLTLGGITAEVAGAAAIMARVWFLAGEIGLFGIGVLLSRGAAEAEGPDGPA